MNTLSLILLVLVLVVAVPVVILALAYNRLVTLRNRSSNAYAQIDVQLKRRHDLIPNLVESVKGYMSHERQTLEAVTAARSAATAANARASAAPNDGSAVRAAAAAETGLGVALQRFLVVSEAYPDLKADAHVGKLTEELSSTENRIAFARQAYNDAVMNYNTARQRVPTVLVANAAGFTEAALFEVRDPAQREAVAVSLADSGGGA